MTKKQHPMADMDGPMPYSGQGDIKTRAHKAAQKINARMAKAAVKDKDGKVTHYDTSYDRANKKVDDLLQKARKRKWYKIGEETQLNEISRKLRQSYERANLKDQNRLKNAPEGGVDQERKIARKLKNRKQGYQDAVDRDTGYKSGPNEETLDEIKNKTLKSYMDKVSPPILSHSSRDSRKDKNRAKGFAGAYARVYKNNLPRHKDGAYWNDKYRKEETLDETTHSSHWRAAKKIDMDVTSRPDAHKKMKKMLGNKYDQKVANRWISAERQFQYDKKYGVEEETLDEKKVCVKWQDKPEKKRTKDYKDWEKFMSKEEAMNEEPEHDRAYRYGWSARKTGHPHTNNPHERDSDLHKAWAKGWKSHGGKAFQPFKDAKGKTMGEEKDFELPTQYGGEYSVRKIDEGSHPYQTPINSRTGEPVKDKDEGAKYRWALKDTFGSRKNKVKIEPRSTHNKFKGNEKSLKVGRGITKGNNEETEHLDELKNVAKEYIKKASVDATNKSWNAALRRGNPKTNVKRLKRIEGIANAADRLSGTYTKKVSRGKKGPVWVKHPYHAEEIEQIDELGDLVLQRYKDKVDQTNRTGKGTVGHLRATERQTGKFFVKNKNKLAGGEYKKYHGAGKDWKPSSTASHSNSSKIDRFRKGRPMDSHSNRSKMDRFRKGGPMDSHRKGANIREEEIDEAAKDRPFTKWAAKAIYGDKGSSNLKKGACVTCGSTDQQFRDALSKKEWGISGMCQNCQDKVFSK